jgi:hypothetical protein
VALADLDVAVDLGKRQNRNVQLAGQRLEPPADLRHDLLPGPGTVVVLAAVDQLEVVDDEQADTVVRPGPPGQGGDLRHRAGRRVVDVQRPVVHLRVGPIDGQTLLGRQ